MVEPTNTKFTINRRRVSGKGEETSLDNSSDSIESGQVILRGMYHCSPTYLCKFQKVLCTHDGILLRQASAEFILDLNTSGSLSLVEYSPNKRLSIEWRPNDNILITDDESQDQDEWSLVDTISKRQRTISESRVFNTKCDSPPKPRTLRTELNALKSIEVLSKRQAIRLIKLDGMIGSEYFFQNGNADLFVRSLLQEHVVVKTQTHKQIYDVLDSEAQKLQKTFAELEIDEIKGSGGWFSNIIWRNLDLLAKVPDLVSTHNNMHSNPRSPLRTEEYEVLEQSRSLEGDSHNEVVSSPSDISEIAKDHLPERKICTRGSPLTEKQWRELQTEDGRISHPTHIKEIIFRGGIEHQLRCEVWKYLLNYYLWGDTTIERIERRRKKSIEYYQMKAQWLSMSTEQERNFSGYRDRKCQIEKDVKRTDRTQDFFAGEENPNLTLLQDILMTYVMYNFDLGYVQGMSDLLAPILYVQQNEVDAFWCFVGFMDLVFSNFDIDQAGMKRQLNDLKRLLEFCNHELFEYLKAHGSDNMYFCFRWLLIWYKREFHASDILELWECLWTQLPGPNFHLFIGVSILDQQKDTFIQNKFEFNEILKHVNELSNKIDLRRTLELAEAIYGQIKSSDFLTNEIRLIIGDEPIENSKDEKENESEDGFDELVKELTPEEIEVKQQKFEEACDQSMFLSYL